MIALIFKTIRMSLDRIDKRMFKQTSHFLLVTIIVITSLSCAKTGTYVDKTRGFEVTGPPNWRMGTMNDGHLVFFSKFVNKREDNSIISIIIMDLNVEAGSPSPLDYLNNEFLPSEEHNYGLPVKIISEPYLLNKQGSLWATAKYKTDRDVLYTAYVTFSDKYIFIFKLSTRPDLCDDEDLFLAFLDSFKIY